MDEFQNTFERREPWKITEKINANAIEKGSKE